MPVPNYGLLIGKIQDGRHFTGNHYQIRVKAGQEEFRIAVNVQSADGSEVMMFVSSNYEHEFFARIAQAQLAEGFLHIGSGKGVKSWGMDFLRRQVMDFNDMIPMPMREAGPDNDLLEKVDYEIKRAKRQNAILYAWGSPWKDSGRDRYFADMVNQGVHDIHLNQGNPKGRYYDDNGTWQDGALGLYYPQEKRWVVIFLAFQTQFSSLSPNIIHTDDRTGCPILRQPKDDRLVAREVFNDEENIRIISALVPHQKDREQKVLLLNRSSQTICLENWKLINRDHQEFLIPSSLVQPYSTSEIKIHENNFSLAKEGDIIVLLDHENFKIHGVSYTEKQNRLQDRMICF